MSGKTRDWLIAFGYVALIYATLEIARLPLSFLRSHGWLRLSLAILFTLSSVGIITFFIRRHGLSSKRIFPLLFIGAAYYFAARTVKTPEEQVHFFEYGLVGVFFLRALSHHVQKISIRYLAAWFLGCGAGWIDELLQGLLPHRHYDIHDVQLNAISVALGLLVAFLYAPSNSN
jgi:hypothetical protein